MTDLKKQRANLKRQLTLTQKELGSIKFAGDNIDDDATYHEYQNLVEKSEYLQIEIRKVSNKITCEEKGEVTVEYIVHSDIDHAISVLERKIARLEFLGVTVTDLKSIRDSLSEIMGRLDAIS